MADINPMITFDPNKYKAIHRLYGGYATEGTKVLAELPRTDPFGEWFTLNHKGVNIIEIIRDTEKAKGWEFLGFISDGGLTFYFGELR